ncbi:uncharacterized protein LOC111883791 [Lactuca sativa]|uniref:uncharacterized protein LOC111883791 n=1 Tax=Lactuca sativa TaxID=4236 RepID=UPI000CD9C1FA|nr:uncharacterized protein LOC111883791 [Lactuca sativa]
MVSPSGFTGRHPTISPAMVVMPKNLQKSSNPKPSQADSGFRFIDIMLSLGCKLHPGFTSYLDYKYELPHRHCTGRQSVSSVQKCTAAMRMLAYGVAADVVDEYLCIAETTTIKCVKKFVKAIISVFGDEYLRRPTVEYLQRLLHLGHERGFLGMLGSIDCMHWEWKNCPVPWHGQYARGDHESPTIMLEAVASQDLWIWHAFFGLPGTLNDINVLDL